MSKKTVKLNITFGDKKPNDIVEIDAELADIFISNGNATEVEKQVVSKKTSLKETK